MKVPLSEREIRIQSTMPRSPDGKIVNPFYVGHLLWGKKYISELGDWCRRTPKADWPDWLSEFVKEAKRQREQSQEGPEVSRFRRAIQGYESDVTGSWGVGGGSSDGEAGRIQGGPADFPSMGTAEEVGEAEGVVSESEGQSVEGDSR